jgi:hypothetical protein
LHGWRERERERENHAFLDVVITNPLHFVPWLVSGEGKKRISSFLEALLRTRTRTKEEKVYGHKVVLSWSFLYDVGIWSLSLAF